MAIQCHLQLLLAFAILYINGFHHMPKSNRYFRSLIRNSELMSTSSSSSSPSTTTLNNRRNNANNKPFIETDYLGMIDFCLLPTDVALSSSSRSKVLNEVTNDVFRTLMIGYDPAMTSVISKLNQYREKVETLGCELPMSISSSSKDSNNLGTASAFDEIADSKEYYINVCDEDITMALDYIDKLEALVMNGSTAESVVQGGVYARGYKRLLTTLKDAGCIVSTSTSSNKVVGSSNRPRPLNSNICLSLLDQQYGTNKRTRTRDLNKISNCVSRAMLYGSRKEKDFLAESVENMVDDFVVQWSLDGAECQEALFLKALALLLRDNLAVVEAAVTFSEAPSSTVFGTSNISSSVADIVNYDSTVTVDTQQKQKKNRTIPNLRLYDTYLNAFQRVVETCLTEIGIRAGRNVPQNEEILYNFLNWEKGLRKNLTSSAWPQNPSELVGQWKLVDVVGSGSLTDLSLSVNSGNVGSTENAVSVEFLRDGGVALKEGTGAGLEWFFTPGPAHLDTCEFTIQSKVSESSFSVSFSFILFIIICTYMYNLFPPLFSFFNFLFY